MSGLVSALIAARKKVQATVYKAGQNRTQNYAFVGHEHVLAHVRAALLENELSLEQTKVEFVQELLYSTRNGQQTAWLWRGTHVLIHSSGEIREYVFLATTGTNDKSGFVASTSLDRTALLRVMQLAGSNEENPEHDSHEPTQRGGQASRNADADEIGAMVNIDLPRCVDKDSLALWAQRMIELVGPVKATPPWKAFQARCEALNLQPRDVVNAAQKAA